ncbi:hypothetical protein DSO57_1006070 [Entomophthora muscae]|uniref:Uncharacterized protein n=1 Tax=Entomophthora muscae TaxID=34485 RepID=A0ACC2U6V6_9FUNG|nr:hypothetical protein DSO57_1006070 [Entomophthora muscae]
MLVPSFTKKLNLFLGKISQERVIKYVATSPTGVLESRALVVFLRVSERHISGSTVRIDNFLSLETQGQGRDSNSESDHPRAVSPKDQRAGCLRFSEIKPPQAEAEPNSQNVNISKNLRATAPEEGLNNLPNGGRKIPTVNLMSMKSTLVINQDSSPDENAHLKPTLMTMAKEQKN